MDKPQNQVSDANAQPVDLFKVNTEKMVATNVNTYTSSLWRWYNHEKTYGYTPEEILSIISSDGATADQANLSRRFFISNGYYNKIILYYANLLKYVGFLVPNPKQGKPLSANNVTKKYYNALDYVEDTPIQNFCSEWALTVLIEGEYFGYAINSKEGLGVIKLPNAYCRTRFKDLQGNDVIEFNVGYFDSITDEDARQVTLDAFPKEVQKAYKKWKNNNGKQWIILPLSNVLHFYFPYKRPLFVSIIPSILTYGSATESELNGLEEEVKKLVVQQIPHLSDGRLLFEPPEAETMHQGTVDMLKHNKNLNVLTTYADVDVVTSSTSKTDTDELLNRMEQNIYSQAGITGQIFASNTSTSLKVSLQNDLALMMYLANQFSDAISQNVNAIYGNGNVKFSYKILPVSYYNEKDYIEESFKLTGSGYSIFIPSIALGISQRDLGNVKELENSIHELHKKMIPLQTSYTQSSDSQSGRPVIPQEEKAGTTVETEEARK